MAAAVVVAGAVGLTCGPSAMAHESSPPGTASVAQTLNGHELTVILGLPEGPGPLTVSVTAQDPVPSAPLRVSTSPGATGGRSTGEASLLVDPATHVGRATMALDRAGPWEVVLDDGTGSARIPVTVADPDTPGWVWTVRLGLATAAAAALGAAFANARGRRRSAAGVAVLAVVALSVATTSWVLGAQLPTGAPSAGGFTGAAPEAAVGGIPDMPGMSMSHMPGMSMGQASGGATGTTEPGGAVVLTANATPVAATSSPAVDLALTLTDGSSGAPVDDLAVHDDALIHLVVAGPNGSFSHVHPVRTGPGRYAVRLASAGPGAYGVFAEMQRSGGGHQLTRSAFTLDGPPPAPALDVPADPGSNGAITLSAPRPVVGAAVSISVRFRADGDPATDMQSWLGMAGHLMIIGPGTDAPGATTDPALTFAHVHDMDLPRRSGDGSTVGFTYAFPRPGRYQLWVQVQRHWRLVTVPATVDVDPVSPAAS